MTIDKLSRVKHRSMVVHLLFLTSTMVFAYSTLRLIVSNYRNFAIFFSAEACSKN